MSIKTRSLNCLQCPDKSRRLILRTFISKSDSDHHTLAKVTTCHVQVQVCRRWMTSTLIGVAQKSTAKLQTTLFEEIYKGLQFLDQLVSRTRFLSSNYHQLEYRTSNTLIIKKKLPCTLSVFSCSLFVIINQRNALLMIHNRPPQSPLKCAIVMVVNIAVATQMIACAAKVTLAIAGVEVARNENDCKCDKSVSSDVLNGSSSYTYFILFSIASSCTQACHR